MVFVLPPPRRWGCWLHVCTTEADVALNAKGSETRTAGSRQIDTRGGGAAQTKFSTPVLPGAENEGVAGCPITK